jgi:enamidase
MEGGVLEPAKPADIVRLDAPEGGMQPTAPTAGKVADIPTIGAVVTAGIPRFVECSRNTPATTRAPHRLARRTRLLCKSSLAT